MTVKSPNFLIVGAAKAGTTSLYYYLKEHPKIYLPEKKELRFFSGESLDFEGLPKTFEEYASFLKKSRMKKR